MTTPETLARLKSLLEKATPAPWFDNSYSAVYTSNQNARQIYSDLCKTLCDTDDDWTEEQQDAEYHANTNVCKVPRHHGDTAIGRHAVDMSLIAELHNAASSLIADSASLADATERCARLEEAVLQAMTDTGQDIQREMDRRCSECHGELSACGEMTSDGPSMDCRVCQAEERVKTLEEQLASLRRSMRSNRVDETHTPKGYERLEDVWSNGKEIVVMGTPPKEGEPGWEDHNCDDMGCSAFGLHVLARAALDKIGKTHE